MPHGLAIMEDPVTWSQWWAIMGRRPDAMSPDTLRSPADTMPVTYVSRADCEEFALRLAAKLSSLRPGVDLPPPRLMSDQEWTLACACGPLPAGRRSSFILHVDDAVFRWSSSGRSRKNNPSEPQQVSHPHNRTNAWGLRGMQGNVRELAWHHQQASRYVAMNGGFRSEVQELRPDHSVQFHGPSEDVGFRLVRALMPDEAATFEGGFQA